ncbi:MAG: hypothetical protein K1V80_05840 [Muribaculaceae bacterium]
MTDTYDKLLRLNVELEGALRVLRERDSADALEVAREKFDCMKSLFDSLHCTCTTTVKEEEAEGAEEAPLEEPSVEEVAPAATVVESDSEAVEAALDESAPCAAEVAEAKSPAPAVQTRTVGDIRKAMTLNDKFLFRRELFGGNDAELNDTIELLASMHSFDEVEEYIYDDLQWDRKNPTVVDFMEIIKTYFINPSKA